MLDKKAALQLPPPPTPPPAKHTKLKMLKVLPGISFFISSMGDTYVHMCLRTSSL